MCDVQLRTIVTFPLLYTRFVPNIMESCHSFRFLFYHFYNVCVNVNVISSISILQTQENVRLEQQTVRDVVVGLLEHIGRGLDETSQMPSQDALGE